MKTEKVNSQWQNITSFEKACERTKRDPKILDQIVIPDEKLKKTLTAAFILMVAFEAVNTNDDGTIWEAQGDEWRYFSYHSITKSGGGFSGSFCDGWDSGSDVGSRLETDSSEKVHHLNTYFEEQFKDFKLKKRD